MSASQIGVDALRGARERVARGERVGLATVVATRGSTPQKVGARLLVCGDGQVTGTLGGGAVEAEAVREAREALAHGRPALREYALSTGTDDWGLACGGTMVVFVEALDRGALAWLGPVVGLDESGAAVTLVTPVDGPEAGRRHMVAEAGAAPGVAAEALAAARRLAPTGGAELVAAAGVSWSVEAFVPAPDLVILGAGHVGKALAGLGRFLGVGVTVVDDRPEYASRERFPEADRVVAGAVAEAVGRLRVHPGTAIVVAMRNQDLDYEATLISLRTPARYVGLIGARRKAILIVERLLAAGVPVDRVRTLKSPIGLDIGARTPEEIAVAILAEWIMARQGGAGAPLRLGDELFTKAAARAER